MQFGHADDATDAGLDKSAGRNSDSASASLSAQLWGEVGKLALSDSQTKTSMDSSYTNLELNTSSLYDTKWHQYVDAGDKGGGGSAKPDASEAKSQEKEKPADKAAEKAVEKEQRSPIPVDRIKLTEVAEKAITNPDELARFKQDMAEFEKRAQEKGLTTGDVIETYRQIGRILEAKGIEPLSPRERTMIAEQVMHQAAHPESIDQGTKSTCTVATIESRLYSLKPQEAAELAADVATTGKFQTADGKTIVLDKQSIKPDDEAKANPPRDGHRSFASQLFQVTAANIFLQGRDADRDIRYEQHPPNSPSDSGERLVDYSSGKAEVLKDESGKPQGDAKILVSDLERVSRQITDKHHLGNADSGFVIINDVHKNEPNTVKIDSPQKLTDTLEALKKAGKLPAIIHVDDRHEPFLSDSGGGIAGGSGQGSHVITVTDFDKTTGDITVDNQWGSKSDRRISANDLYVATLPVDNPKTVAALEASIQKDRAEGHVDSSKELELLRIKHNFGGMSDGQFDKELVKIMKAAEQRWTREAGEGTLNASEQKATRDRFDNFVKGIRDFSRKHAVREAMKGK